MNKKLNFVGVKKNFTSSKESHNYGMMRIMKIFEPVFVNMCIIWLTIRSPGEDLRIIAKPWIMNVVCWTISEILSKVFIKIRDSHSKPMYPCLLYFNIERLMSTDSTMHPGTIISYPCLV